MKQVFLYLQFMITYSIDNCASYNLIGAVEFNSDLTPCDKKVSQNTGLSLHM